MAEHQSYKNYHDVDYDYVDKIPEGWQLLPNYAIFEERIERGHENEELLSVTIGRGVIRQAELDKKDSSTADKSKYLLVHKGDMVYSMRFRQGASGYSNYTGIVSPACTVLKPKKGVQINQRFFHYMFRTGFYKNYVERYAYGIADGQMPLRFFDFKRMYTIVPPVETQNAIVAYLDRRTFQVDEFIRKKRRLIDCVIERKRRSIERFVTKGLNESVQRKESGSDLFGCVPVHWQTKRLRFVAKKVKTGSTPSSKRKDYFENPEFDWFTPGDFNESQLLVNAHRKVELRAIFDKEIHVFPAKSVLMIGVGGTVGKVGIIEEPASCNQQINAIMFTDEIIPEYGLHLLSILGRNVLNTLDYSALPILNQGATKDFPFLVPPISEQEQILRKINTLVSVTDATIDTIKSEIESAVEFRESLITTLVTGSNKVSGARINSIIQH